MCQARRFALAGPAGRMRSELGPKGLRDATVRHGNKTSCRKSARHTQRLQQDCNSTAAVAQQRFNKRARSCCKRSVNLQAASRLHQPSTQFHPNYNQRATRLQPICRTAMANTQRRVTTAHPNGKLCVCSSVEAPSTRQSTCRQRCQQLCVQGQNYKIQKHLGS